MKTFLFKLIFFSMAFILLERFCHHQTRGFRISKIHSNLPHNPKWSLPPLSSNEMEEVKKALNQPYRFLDSGGQCYAFVSKDQQYVLKFFKHHHMRPSSLLDHLPTLKVLTPFLEKQKKKRTMRLEEMFTSFTIAFERLRDQTALLYLHLNKSEDLNTTLKLYDAIGIRHRIDLDNIEFALQRKASMAYPTLTTLATSGEIEAAKVRIASLLDLMITRCKQGIADHDPRKRNFGFIKEQAVEIDLGSFTLDDSLMTESTGKRTFFFETVKLRRWVKKYHPELFDFLEEEINWRLTENFEKGKVEKILN
ncbi:MAG: hypothetical protein KR126chlam1_00371 [Chlamydiae bacterium]|nr:hypothetical protein [Chlamydiota bacterium]